MKEPAIRNQTRSTIVPKSVVVSLIFASVAGHLAASEPAVSEIIVHVDRPTVALPEMLYGLFYEDINYSGDGGLYAELVQNRSFEYYPVEGWNRASRRLSPLFAWQKVERGGGACTLTVEDVEPLNEKNTKYVRLQIEKAGEGVGLANAGFDGMYVAAGDTYDFSFYARRTHSLEAPVHVSIQGAAGELGRAVIDKLSSRWTKYEASIEVSDTDEQARLVLLTTGEGDICMDMISLFPRKTFKGRKNGLRADLAQALADLKPATFRFPGGCIVHGHGLANAYRWKDTVGDVAERKPNWNLWGYHQSYGLGFFEYFQFCEDINAEPLPILPVGISCGFRQPFQNEEIDRLQPWIDDAVDLVEFANGSVDTKWGSLRAEMGHPAPFNLKYIGLGNEEHYTREFERRFPYFVRALREQCPEIKIVGTSGLGTGIPIYNFMAQQGVDLSDEHYYESPEWFITNQDRFDDFDRSKPKVFVGEYASRGNSLYNAVSEACFLTGIERNADIVHMTAYAPLLARYRFTQWRDANLIWFDHKTVVRTPNYYVQQLFSLNKGDRFLKNEAVFHAEAAAASGPSYGRIGVGTWNTTAVFDDIRVSSGDRTLVEEGFAEGTANWRVVAGRFAAEAGAYVQADEGATPAVSLGPTSIDEASITYSLRAKKTGGREGFLIVFGSRRADRYYWWNIGGWGNTRHAIEKGGADFREGKMQLVSKPGRIRQDVWYDIRIELSDNRIRCFLNDQLIHDVTPQQPQVGVAASREDESGDTILKIANPTPRSYATQINLRGVQQVDPTGALTLLTGSKSDVNDLRQPDRVKPTVRRIPVAASFDYTVPPMSVQFIRLKTRN
jgi:alpha-L-arabinofuranosidase